MELNAINTGERKADPGLTVAGCPPPPQVWGGTICGSSNALFEAER